MSKTVTSLFDSETEAMAVIHRIESEGISHGDICLFGKSGDNRYWTGSHQTPIPTSPTYLDNDIVRYLTDNGVPDRDAHIYAEGVRRGNALVAVRCRDKMVDRVVDLLDTDAVLDIDEHQNAWRREGWRGYDAAMADPETVSRRVAGPTGNDELIPLAEEELHVGKRDVGRGRVRVSSHVAERPVEAQGTLRNERVEIERRPVDDAARKRTNDDLFRQRSIEAEERIQEPIVTQQARANEELVVHKDVGRRTETVSDSARETAVDVEDERGNRVSKSGAIRRK